MRRTNIQCRLVRADLFVFALAVAVGCTERVARADDTIKHRGDHPAYAVEIEPHLVFGWDNVYSAGGFGFGARFGIPIVQNGFVPEINNSVAISFGLDIIHYEACWYDASGNCTANYVDFPVTMQWNFYVAKRWSVFGEPGLLIYHGFINDCPADRLPCRGSPNVTGVLPALYLGGRFHLNERTSLTMRVGFPAFSFGFSFFL